ncbi:unnamed protein product, partial [Polarella glacialis]
RVSSTSRLSSDKLCPWDSKLYSGTFTPLGSFQKTPERQRFQTSATLRALREGDKAKEVGDVRRVMNLSQSQSFEGKGQGLGLSVGQQWRDTSDGRYQNRLIARMISQDRSSIGSLFVGPSGVAPKVTSVCR